MCSYFHSSNTTKKNLPPGSRKSHSSKQNILLEAKPIKCDYQTSEPESLVPCNQFTFSYLPFHANLFYSTLAVSALAIYFILLLRNVIIQLHIHLDVYVGFIVVYNTHIFGQYCQTGSFRDFNLTPRQFFVISPFAKKAIFPA